MHIVYIITKLELGGAQKVCLALFYGLKEAHIQTTLISGNEGALIKTITPDESTIFLPSLKREISIKGLFSEIQSFFSLIKVLQDLKKKSSQPLIIHTHSTKAGILGRWAAFFAQADKIIHTVHGFAFHEHQNRLTWFIIFACEWITAFITDHFIVVSSHDAATGNKLIPWFKNNHTIIRAAAFTKPPINFTRPLRTFKKTDAPCIIGTTSCFKPQKNLSDLIKIFSVFTKTTSRNARLEIIGDGEQRAELEALVKKLEISDLVTFLGWQLTIAPWLARWDFFALTSLWEGLPCAVVEARLFKLPTITYNTGGIKDVITNNRNGILIEKYDLKSFVEALESCHNNPIFYNNLAQHSDNLDTFEIPFMVNEHIKLYKKLSH